MKTLKIKNEGIRVLTCLFDAHDTQVFWFWTKNCYDEDPAGVNAAEENWFGG